MSRIVLILSWLLLGSILFVSAQDEAFEEPVESGRIFALSSSGGLALGELPEFPLPAGTIDVDWNPVDPSRWARVDAFGLLRFVDPNSDQRFEGTYTFSPFYDGYTVDEENPAENKLFVRQVEWSPDGEMLAFRIQNEAQPDASQGVWFWQPLRELATDPSYQLMGHCPPFCSMFGVPEDSAGWRSLNIEWSSDNQSILVTTNLLSEGRRALDVRRAERDPQRQQLETPPNFLRYEYGHWAQDGENIVVSGRNPQNEIVFGIIDRTGQVVEMTPAADIGLAWVQDAVHTPDGEVLMLGSAIAAGAPLQILNAEGEALTAPIGEVAPNVVRWSPDARAVLLQTDTATYVALVDGAIYELTGVTENSPNMDWVLGGLPSTLRQIPLPQPVATAEDIELTRTSQPPTDAAPEEYAIGQILVLTSGTLDIYTEPAGDAEITGVMLPGDELIITAGPVEDGETIWYRVQTLNYTGWIRNLQNLAVADS